MYNRIDWLFLNAGVNSHFQFKQIKDSAVFQKLMSTNFYVNVNLTRLAFPYMKNCKGKIVVISSLSGKFGLPSRSAYCASKFALTGFFESLRTQQDIVDIIMVYPTSISTPMRQNSIAISSGDGRLKNKTPISNTSQAQKRQNPEQIAAYIIKSIQLGKKDIYIPFKGYIGIILQPMFPNFIREKLKNAAKL